MTLSSHTRIRERGYVIGKSPLASVHVGCDGRRVLVIWKGRPALMILKVLEQRKEQVCYSSADVDEVALMISPISNEDVGTQYTEMEAVPDTTEHSGFAFPMMSLAGIPSLKGYKPYEG